MNGRVKAVHPEKGEMILSYRHPVTGEEETLALKVDSETGFTEEVRLRDLKENDPVTADYQELPEGVILALQIRRVPVKGVPIDKPLPLLLKRSEEASGRVNFLHGLKLKEEENFLAAEGLLRKAIEVESENADYHFELGNLYLEQGNLAGARRELEQAVMISPAHLPAQFNLGLAYRELGMFSEARSQFKKVLERDPSHVKAELQIGYTYQAEGFMEEAREAFQTARSMDYSDPKPKLALEDLAQWEEEAALRSRAEMERSLGVGTDLARELWLERFKKGEARGES